MAGWRSELAGCRSTLSMLEIKVRISETKYLSFYKSLVSTMNILKLFDAYILLFRYILYPHSKQMSITMAIFLTIGSLMISLVLSTPLLIVTKLEIRRNQLTNVSTSYCYEVKSRVSIEYLNFEKLFYLTPVVY